nr:basic leucine zipper transcriptional factor ATF-like 3 isoform X4 [Macaca nemestrina]
MAPPWPPPTGASLRVGGLRVPSGVSEPPRDFHEARGAGGKSQQGWIWDPESPEDDDRKVRRREKNRVAAQRSRKKQTQKADKLHEFYASVNSDGEETEQVLF